MTQPTQPQSLASSLESFGSIDWDAEYEELVTTDDKMSTLSEPAIVATEDTEFTRPEPEKLQPESQEAPLVEESTSDQPDLLDSTFADDTTPLIAASPDCTITTDPLFSNFEDISLYSDETADTTTMLPQDSFATWEHPGWSWRESASWCEWTATSPEVSAWALSPGIDGDADWIIGASRYGDDYAHDDIPRVASLLRRAYEYAYNVPENVRFPALARGFKAVPRRGAVVQRERFLRGAKGLKERRELRDSSPVADYMPIGETSQTRMGVYAPQPSRLSEVWLADEEEMEKDVETEEESSEEEWWAWFESSGGEDGEGATPDTGSVESLADGSEEEDEIPATPSRLTTIPPQSTDAIEGEEHAAVSCELADHESEDDDTLIADVTDEVENPTTPSKPTLIIPLPPRTPVRSSDALLHDPSPSPKLTGTGLLRNMALDDMAPQTSPMLLSPALALRDMNAGKKLAPVPTLYQVFVEQYDEKTIEKATESQQDERKKQNAEDQHSGEESAGLWTTTAAAVVALIGGFTVFLG